MMKTCDSLIKIVVIDGQGGRIGCLVIDRLKSAGIARDWELLAVGTNSAATGAMLKAGADYGATGENPVIVACRDADYIIGPVGILAADALMGEVTPPMAAAVAASAACKILLPLNKCGLIIAGVSSSSPGELAADAVSRLLKML